MPDEYGLTFFFNPDEATHNVENTTYITTYYYGRGSSYLGGKLSNEEGYIALPDEAVGTSTNFYFGFFQNSPSGTKAVGKLECHIHFHTGLGNWTTATSPFSSDQTKFLAHFDPGRLQLQPPPGYTEPLPAAWTIVNPVNKGAFRAQVAFLMRDPGWPHKDFLQAIRMTVGTPGS